MQRPARRHVNDGPDPRHAVGRPGQDRHTRFADVADPASRDQDDDAGHRGRFLERVRRAWDIKTTPELVAAPDLEALAAVIARQSGKTGHDVPGILERLQWFEALEHEGLAPRRDPLIRPGASADGAQDRRTFRLRRP